MGAVSPLACAEEVQSTATIRQSCPGRRGQAEGGAKTILTLAGLDGYTVDLSRLPQGGVLDSEHNRLVSQYCIHKKRLGHLDSFLSAEEISVCWCMRMKQSHCVFDYLIKSVHQMSETTEKCLF